MKPFQNWFVLLWSVQGFLMNFSIGSSRTDEFVFLNFGEENGNKSSSIMKTVTDGERKVTLECLVSNSQQIQFHWILNDKLIMNTTRCHQIESNLFISRVVRQFDEGDFRCAATNTTSGFTKTSPPVKLNIVWISPTATLQLSAPNTLANIKAGVEVILKCKVEGTSEVNFKWYRNGQEIVSSDAVIIRDQRLHIPKVTSEDNGSYDCSARNEAGTAETENKFHLSVEYEGVPKIIFPPQDQIVKANSAAKFHCAFEQYIPIQWFFHDNGPLKNSSRYTVFKNGSLIIHQVLKSDEGTYKCLGSFATFPEEEPQIFSASLRTSYLHSLSNSSLDPTPLIPGHVLAYPKNSAFEIFCEKPLGLPSPSTWWEDSSGKVISNLTSVVNLEGSVSTRDSNTLVFSGMSQELTGSYTCWAENSEGITRTSFQLSVAMPPTIFGHPRSTIALEGEYVTFMCQFQGSGFPISRVHWLRNLHPITQKSSDSTLRDRDTEYSEHSRISIHEHNSTLIINPVRLTDIGQYVCEIITPGFLPVRSEPGKLSVKESLRFTPKPLDRKLELGSTSKIHCKAHGATPPVVRWVKDKLDGQPTISWPDHIQDHNGTLYFQEVQSTDRGFYSCLAENLEGYINTTIYVDVIVSPRFLVTPKNPTEAIEGFALMIHCKADGDPIPTISWDRNSIMNAFDPSRFQIFDNGSLLITQVLQDDEGSYACTAGNSGGLKREEVNLIVRRDNVMTKTVSITLSVAAGYMLLVIGLMLWCRYRQLKRKQEYLSELRGCGDEGDTEMKDTVASITHICNGNGPLLLSNGIIKAEASSVKSYGETTKSSNGSNGGVKVASTTASLASHQSQTSQTSKRSNVSNYDEISSTRSDLQFVMLLGHGNFGEVFLAKARNVKEGEDESMVMVKSLQTREETSLFEFKRELDIYHKLNHENVTRLVRICRDMDPHYMIMEYSDWGDLKQFLLATRKDHPHVPKPPQLTLSQIVQVAKQVARGMEHLSNHRFVHKDLATRNCLISSGLRIKISNPGLCRDTYTNEYYTFRNQMIPIRWMPYEAVIEDDFSTKSDVFSFGVVVWEIFHQAAIPFTNSSNEDVLESLQKNALHWKPSEMEELVPKALRCLLSQCWDACPRNRPTFSSITITLDEITRKGFE